MEKICPKCGAAFVCKHDDILNCQCSQIALNRDQLDYIKANFDSCLCQNCLKEIKIKIFTKK